ncbi:MAG: glycosyltransferase family 2 protein [Myxococcota bacterium]
MEPLTWLTWAIASPSALALGMTTFNVATWPRGVATSRVDQKISILIPARNEEATIGQCVHAALASEHPLHEVLVFDDGSTDRTPEILAQLAARDDRLKVIQGHGLPDGWVGKPHACHNLAKHATGDVLFFVDADTFLDPSGVARVVGMMRDMRAQVVTAVPRQITRSWPERLILPLLHMTYTSWFPLVLTHLSEDPRFLAANGQILAIARAEYDRIGGFESVKRAVVDDMALCRRVKSTGSRVVFADGFHIASCRMYTSAREVWEGFSKNIYPGLGASPVALAVVLILYFTAFVLPYLMWPLGLLYAPQIVGAALAGIGVNLALRFVLALRFRQPPEGLLVHPAAVVGLLAIAVNSWRWHRAGQIKWSGRVYAPEEDPRPTNAGLEGQ